MVFFFSFVIIVTFIFLPKKLVESSSNNIVRVIIKGSDSNWFVNAFKYCSLDNFYEFLEKPFIEFISPNYSTSLEIILDIIIGKTFQAKLNQSELILIATDIDEDATTFVSDIIAPYDSIWLFDVNRNNYGISYQQNSAPLYVLLRPEDLCNYIKGKLNVKNLVLMVETAGEVEDDLLDFYKYAIKNTDLCIIKYALDFKNTSYVSAIVNELISYEHIDKLNILFEASLSDLNMFLYICETNGLKITNMYISIDYVTSNDAQFLIRKYNNTIVFFHLLIGFTVDASRSTFCFFFLLDLSSTTFSTCFKAQKEQNFFVEHISWSNINNNSVVATTIGNDVKSRKIVGDKCALITCPPGYEQILTSSNTKEKKQRWRSCFPCLKNYFKENSGNEECQKCPSEFVSNANKTACVDSFTLDALTFQSIEGLIITAFSTFCSLFSFFTIATLVHKRETPVVKSANFSLFTAQIVCHLMISLSVPLLYINKPLLTICSTRHLIVGFLLTTSASIIYIKTRKYLRIFQRVCCLSSREKIVATSMDAMIVTFILIVQVLMGAVLLIKSPPAVLPHLNYEKMTRTFQCSSDWQFAAQALYIGFLLLMCSVQSFHARNLPSYFNETHSITYSTGVSCIFLICYFPIYYGNDNIKARIFAVPLLILVVNLTFMGIIFTPKLITIYLKPKTNTKSNLQSELKKYSKTVLVDS